MPSIVKSETWLHTGSLGSTLNVSNTPSGTAAADFKAMLVLLAGRLLAFTGASTNKPVCVGSSNGTTAALDGTNRWSTNADIVIAAAGSAHSWIVFKFVGIFNLQLLIATDNVSTDRISVIWSLVGFSGGSTTANPTAADSTAGLNQEVWLNSSVSNQFRMHMALSANGQQFRMVIYRNNAPLFDCKAGRMLNPETGWTNPLFFKVIANSQSSTLLNALTIRDSAGYFRGYNPSGAAQTFITTCEVVGRTDQSPPERYNQANDVSGSLDGIPVGLWCDTATIRGRMGQVPDLFIIADLPVDGDTAQKAPNTPLLDWMVSGHTLFPWDQATTPQVA